MRTFANLLWPISHTRHTVSAQQQDSVDCVPFGHTSVSLSTSWLVWFNYYSWFSLCEKVWEFLKQKLCVWVCESEHNSQCNDRKSIQFMLQFKAIPYQLHIQTQKLLAIFRIPSWTINTRGNDELQALYFKLTKNTIAAEFRPKWTISDLLLSSLSRLDHYWQYCGCVRGSELWLFSPNAKCADNRGTSKHHQQQQQQQFIYPNGAAVYYKCFRESQSIHHCVIEHNEIISQRSQ